MATAPHEKTAGIPAGTWAADKAHTRIGFAAKHRGFTSVRGEFREYDGELVIAEGLSQAKATAAIRVASVDTHQDKRDEHLRSADFFDAGVYPEITFESKQFEQADDDTVKIVGDLSIRGVTNEVELEVELEGHVASGLRGEERIGLAITGQLSRKDYGITPTTAFGLFNAVVADKVNLVLDIAAIKHDHG